MLDGTTVDPTQYTWHPYGSVWRTASGWGDSSSQVVVDFTYGYATVPEPLAHVTATAAGRLLTNPEQLAREEVEGASSLFHVPGLTVGERITLDRFRRRLWPAQ